MKHLKLRLCPFVLSADDFSNDADKKEGASSACIYIYIFYYFFAVRQNLITECFIERKEYLRE